MALALLTAVGRLSQSATEGLVFAGDLAFGGQTLGIAGALPIALHARRSQAQGVVLPQASAGEAESLGSSLPVYVAESLGDVIEGLRKGLRPPAFVPRPRRHLLPETDIDMGSRPEVMRALQIAAAGGHNLLLVGPPGSGQAMEARRLPGLLPELGRDETVEVLALYSAAGLLQGRGQLAARPFRAPHHSVSMAGLLGGGSPARPGEISLAHQGVLFLDEVQAFPLPQLEALRGPIKDRRVHLIRRQQTISYPAKVLIVGAMPPCPCGHQGDPRRSCRCSPERVRRHWDRLGRLRGLFELHVRLQPTTVELGRARGLPTTTLREQVARAQRLLAREAALRQNEDRLHRVARTISCLDLAPEVREEHLAEAARLAVEHIQVP